MSDNDSGFYGPALPPTLAQRQQNYKETESAYGPALPPSQSNVSRLEDSQSELDSDSQENESSTVSAQLPAGSGSNTKSCPEPRIFGPALPSGFSQHQHQKYEDSDSSDDGNLVGPLPPDQITATSLALEERALEIKLAQISEANKHGNSPEEREEWMLKPPEIMAKIGIEKKTKFSHSKCERDRDQSAWTETPASKKRKAEDHKSKSNQKKDLQAYAERVSAKKRDDEQEHIANKLKKKHKRDKSLLELHREKKKKDKESKPTDQQRRPFNREKDLQMNQLNSRQVKSVIDKAKILDSRFSSGSNKYL